MNNEIISAIVRNIGQNVPKDSKIGFTPSNVAETEIVKLHNMSICELQDKWEKLTGQKAPKWNKSFFIPRLAHKIQEIIYGQFLSITDQENLFKYLFSPERQKPQKIASSNRCFPALIKTGQIIEIKHDGGTSNIVTLTDGYLFENKKYKNLGSVLRKILGRKANKQELEKCIKMK